MANRFTDAVHSIQGFKGTDEYPFGANEKAVLMAIAWHARDREGDPQNGTCYPAYALLVQETYLSDSTVTRTIRNLKGLRFFDIGHGRQNSNLYKLDYDRIVDAASDNPEKRPFVAKDGRKLNGKKYTKKSEPKTSFLDLCEFCCKADCSGNCDD